MKYVLSIDPGMSSGIILGHYDDDTPYERDAFWQVDGGIDGFKAWRVLHHFGSSDTLSQGWDFPINRAMMFERDLTIVCEKFVPLATDRAFRIDELEPIRIEGALEAWGHDVIWQRASCQILAGGDTPAARKKNSDNVLKKLGLWTTGRDVGMKDSDDVRSATKHTIHWLIANGHKPTIDAIMKE